MKFYFQTISHHPLCFLETSGLILNNTQTHTHRQTTHTFKHTRQTHKIFSCRFTYNIYYGFLSGLVTLCTLGQRNRGGGAGLTRCNHDSNLIYYNQSELVYVKLLTLDVSIWFETGRIEFPVLIFSHSLRR